MLVSHIHKIANFASTFLLSRAFCTTQQDYPFLEAIAFNANNPIEDRHCYTRLKSINGFTTSVFDGHGGDLTSEFASKNLNKCIDERIAKNKQLNLTTEQMIEKSLIQAYEDIQSAFFKLFKENINNNSYRKVGSCALTAVILKDSLHIANAGDCQGVILSDKQTVKTNLRLNAGQNFQQARLFQKFPEEKDIIIFKRAFYVKGRLQPTRSFGDFYMKYKQYNFTNLNVFTGPYVQAVPLVTHFKLNDEQTNLILATDGLWDELNETQIHKCLQKGQKELGKVIFDKAVDKILYRSMSGVQKLNQIPNRRDLHDDITLINIRLMELRNLL